MAAAEADSHVAALTERLFLDEDDKDITFELSDGLERAHKVVLNAASDVFKTMLKHEMNEKTSGVVKLPDVSKQVMRVFLRLLYTGRVDSSDFSDTEKAPGKEQLVLKQTNVQTDGRRLTSTGGSESSAPAQHACVALLAGGGVGGLEFAVRAEAWDGMSFGIAPAHTNPRDLEEEDDAFLCEVVDGELVLASATDTAPRQGLAVPAGAELALKLHNHVLHFAVDGGDFVAADFDGPLIRTDIRFVPLIEFTRVGQTLEVVRISPSRSQCPLDLLVGATLLAKKYMVGKVFDMCTLVLKERVAAAKEQKDIGAFEEILVAAISGDLFSVRVAALQAAKDGFAELRTKHYKGGLHPAVSQDLQDIWPSAAAKRRRTAHLS